MDYKLAHFMNSGSAECGSAPLDIAVGVHTSNFYDFCNGDMTTYYMYMALMKYGLFASAVSMMKDEHSHDSQVGAGKRRTSGIKSRGNKDAPRGKGSKGGAHFDPSAPIVIEQTEDQKAESHAKRRLTEAQANEAEMKAKTTALELMSTMISQYKTAQDELKNYTGEDVYLRLRGVLEAQVKNAKENQDAALVASRQEMWVIKWAIEASELIQINREVCVKLESGILPLSSQWNERTNTNEHSVIPYSNRSGC